MHIKLYHHYILSSYAPLNISTISLFYVFHINRNVCFIHSICSSLYHFLFFKYYKHFPGLPNLIPCVRATFSPSFYLSPSILCHFISNMQMEAYCVCDRARTGQIIRKWKMTWKFLKCILDTTNIETESNDEKEKNKTSKTI